MTSDESREAQFLTTEHASLLATRSMAWGEASNRTGAFMSSLSAAAVALALVGPATEFGHAFVVFAMIVLALTLFLGVATFVRLSQVNNEDLLWVLGMNRIRAAYVRLSPGIERDFVSGYTLDPEGLARTFGVIDVTRGISPLHVFVTTPAIVGVISSAIAAVMGGMLVIEFGGDLLAAIAVGSATLVAVGLLFVAYARRDGNAFITRVLRDASEPPKDQPSARRSR